MSNALVNLQQARLHTSRASKRLSDLLLKVRPTNSPRSESSLASEMTGTPSTHQQRPSAFLRATLATEIDQALRELHHSAVQHHGPERAAYLLFRLTAHDGKYQTPQWLANVFANHPNACIQAADDADEP